MTYRTTLTLDDHLERRMREIALAHKVSLVDLIRKATEQYADRADATGAAAEALAVFDRCKGLQNPYQELVAEWRVRRNREQLSAIVSGTLRLDTNPPQTYLLRLLTELLNKLGEGDEFLVTTDERFWLDAATADARPFRQPETIGYLAAQLDAIARGMRLFRVFLLGDGAGPSIQSLFQQHRTFLDEVRYNHPERARYVKVHVQNLPGRHAVSAPSQQFACVRRISPEQATLPAAGPDRGCLIVEPRYDSSNRIVELDLRFSNGSTTDDPTAKTYFDRFLAAATDSTSITDY